MLATPRRATALIGSLALLFAGGTARAQEPGTERVTKALGPDLVVRELVPGVWLHTSVKPDRKGRPMPANGLLVTTGKSSVLIDAGWAPASARRLMEWAREELGQPIEHVIVTHAHPDRIGGLPAFLDESVMVYAHAYTARLARLYGLPAFHWTFSGKERLNLGGETFDLHYPGPGHAHDNIVVYLPRRRILYAGCLLKSENATGLGYLEDANLKTWPIAVTRVIQGYRDATILVPGHGAQGGTDLLSHTMEMLERAAQRNAQAQAEP